MEEITRKVNEMHVKKQTDLRDNNSIVKGDSIMRQIIFHEETKTFHLYNGKISYILCVLENGHLGQLYFGKRLHDKADFSYLVEKCERPMTS